MIIKAPHKMATPKVTKRCVMPGCTAWEFNDAGFCRQHSKQSAQDPALKVHGNAFSDAQDQAKLFDVYRGAPALKSNFVVAYVSANPRCLIRKSSPLLSFVCGGNILHKEECLFLSC